MKAVIRVLGMAALVVAGYLLGWRDAEWGYLTHTERPLHDPPLVRGTR